MSPSASIDEIRAAYRATARRLHPDVAGGSAPGMAEVNEAWAVLSDPARRAEYDAGLWRTMAAERSSAMPYASAPVDDGPDLDDLAPEELRAARGLGCLLGLTAVLVTVALLALFIYAFTRSAHLRP